MLRTSLLVALGMGLVLPCMKPDASNAFGSESSTISDREISDAIEDAFNRHPGILHHHLDIKTTDGVVELTGNVNNILEKQRAVGIAQTVKGVRSVLDRIEVKPVLERLDAEIKEDIDHAMVLDPVTDDYEITAEVKFGVALLKGEVDSWQEKRLAGIVAKSVRGVKALKNEIAVKPRMDRPDVELEQEIETVLRWDILIDDARLEVDVQDGKVALSGAVGSAAEKDRARIKAWIVGVNDVDASALEVERGLRKGNLRESRFIRKTDREIEEAIARTLSLDPRVSSANLQVEADDGYVTLRGTVDNLRAKRAAADNARNTVGVWQVMNRIRVRLEADMEDEELRKKVVGILRRDTYIHGYAIDVSVRHGIVYLEGEVKDNFEKARAESMVTGIRGVVAVFNGLETAENAAPFAYDPYVDDAYLETFDWREYRPVETTADDSEIERRINKELWWSPFVDSEDVSVSVSGKVAVLTGEVEDNDELRAAIENAFEGGAIWVENRLRVNGE